MAAKPFAAISRSQARKTFRASKRRTALGAATATSSAIAIGEIITGHSDEGSAVSVQAGKVPVLAITSQAEGLKGRLSRPRRGSIQVRVITTPLVGAACPKSRVPSRDGSAKPSRVGRRPENIPSMPAAVAPRIYFSVRGVRGKTRGWKGLNV